MRRTVFGRNKIPSAPPNSKILSLLFQNDFVDHTGINKIIQNSASLPPFVAGRKGTDYAADFSNHGLTTQSLFPINTSNQCTFSFWMKTSTSSGSRTIVELSNNADVNNAFYMMMNNASAGQLSLRVRNGSNYHFVMTPVADGNWKHVISTIDKTQPMNNVCKIYINNVLSFSVVTTAGSDNSNFGWFKLFIGNVKGNFIGQLAYMEAFNYILSPSQRIAAYNQYL